VVALDGATGELIWAHSLREGMRAGMAPRQLSGRGVSYWTDGKGDERIIYVTTGYRLVALNAKNGSLINGFGTGGMVDLKVGAVKGRGEPIDLERGEIGVHSTPGDRARCGDRRLVVPRGRHGRNAQQHQGPRPRVRRAHRESCCGRSTRFPRPGEFGNDTWENESWADNGNVGVWTQNHRR
jgi:quinoprotein glucose dehydrogenase